MIFIPGNVPSLKNSKVLTRRGIFPSKTVTKYLQSLGIREFNSGKKIVVGYKDPNRPNVFASFRSEWNKMMEGKGYPITIGYHHVRNSKRKFDFSNSVEIIQDLLTAHDFIVDDNVDYVYPVPMTNKGKLINEENTRKKEWYSINKNNPGVFLKIF